MDPNFLVNPYPFYHQWRATSPVLDRTGGGDWVVTGYAEVLAALRDPRLSVDRVGRFLDLLPKSCRRETTYLRDILSGWLFLLDSPRHMALRALLQGNLTSAALGPFAGRIVHHVHDCVDRALDGRTHGEIDLIPSIAGPLPGRVMADLLGFPAEDWGLLRGWTDAVVAFLGGPQAAQRPAVQAQQALKAFVGYLLSHLRKHGPASPIAQVLAVERQEGNISEDELSALLTVLFAAGLQTTGDAIGNAVYALLQTPGAWKDLALDDASMACAVEEFLRYDSPVQLTARIAREDLEHGGQPIRAGQSLTIYLGAANRDPRQFAEPDRLDLRRRENRHLAFSQGAHFCLGATLARLEVRSALQVLLTRLPTMELVGVPRHRPNPAFRGLQSLHLRVRSANRRCAA